MATDDQNHPSIYLGSTMAYCVHCQETESARIVGNPKGVFLERLCPVKGVFSTRIAADVKWYQERTGHAQEISVGKGAKPIKHGCPKDCGICAWHTGALHLPVFSITNDCNLNCPICFTYNRPDKKYYKSEAETRAIIRQILAQRGEGLQLINLTGGEPTLHPELFKILAVCKDEGIERITMNTNGIRIAEDREFAEKIKASGVQLVLSLDTFDVQKSHLIHGADITELKKQALATLEELDIPTTILSVAIKGVNDEEVAELVSGYITKSFVRSITIQNMTFTGKNGEKFQPHEHITIDEVENLLIQKPHFHTEDFFPLASYHPLCYSVAYYLVQDEKVVSLSRLLDKETLFEISRNSYLLNPEKDYTRAFQEGLNRYWAEGGDEDLIRSLKRTLNEMYPPDREIPLYRRREIAEKMIKPLYIHPHMDQDNFDIDRVSRCGDLVPDEKGNMVPACSYNLLYRQKDERFWVERE